MCSVVTCPPPYPPPMEGVFFCSPMEGVSHVMYPYAVHPLASPCRGSTCVSRGIGFQNPSVTAAPRQLPYEGSQGAHMIGRDCPATRVALNTTEKCRKKAYPAGTQGRLFVREIASYRNKRVSCSCMGRKAQFCYMGSEKDHFLELMCLTSSFSNVLRSLVVKV